MTSSTGTQADGRALAGRLFAALQPCYDAAKAAVVTMAAYPPLAYHLDTRQPGHAGRLMHDWGVAVTGTRPELRQIRVRRLAIAAGPLGHGAYPPRDGVDRARFGTAWRAGDQAHIRFGYVAAAWLTLAAQERHLAGTGQDPLTAAQRDAWCAHCAACCGYAFAAPEPLPGSHETLGAAFEQQLTLLLQGTPPGRRLLTRVTADAGGDAEAARARWLVDPRVAEALGGNLPQAPEEGAR